MHFIYMRESHKLFEGKITMVVNWYNCAKTKMRDESRKMKISLL